MPCGLLFENVKIFMHKMFFFSLERQFAAAKMFFLLNKDLRGISSEGNESDFQKEFFLSNSNVEREKRIEKIHN
jgi:hypothetical protein